jgi:hypothetical protein
MRKKITLHNTDNDTSVNVIAVLVQENIMDSGALVEKYYEISPGSYARAKRALGGYFCGPERVEQTSRNGGAIVVIAELTD